MKKLILLLFIPLLSFSQGEQLYADGSDVDQDGNIFEWISYGEQDWSIENAEVVTYRDGTEIPQVTEDTEWSSLTTGAWCYFDYDYGPTKPKLYNWYAVMGIHDAASLTDISLRKEFAPEGWRVPTDSEWTTLEEYLITNGYNYDDTTTDNKIAKALASTTDWKNSENTGAIGNDQSLNNSSGFNAFPEGIRGPYGPFNNESRDAVFWSSTEVNATNAWLRILENWASHLHRDNYSKRNGFTMRFVRNNYYTSLNDFTNLISIFPNPSYDFIRITGVEKELELIITDVSGKKVMSEYVKNKIDISTLEKGTYILNLSDGLNTSTHKIIKE